VLSKLLAVHARALSVIQHQSGRVGLNRNYVSERTDKSEHSCYQNCHLAIEQASGARFVRRISSKPTTYLTGEDLYQIAAIKFEEAAATPEGPARQQILNSAYNFRDLAKMKGWPRSGTM
jgi:hypothetical protein